MVFGLLLIAGPCFAQSVPEIRLRYQLGEALSAQAQAEAKNLQGSDDLKQTQGQRDWWIACDEACRAWALGAPK